MKKIPTLPFVLFLAACAPGNKESAMHDSASMNDTLNVSQLVNDTTAPTLSVQEQTSDTSQLEIRFDETAGLVYERQEPYFTVTIATSQYEATSDVTWYFDAAVTPIYFKETWAAEGNEGSTEFFVQDGDVACAYTEEYNTVEKWCSATGGTRTTMNDESGDASTDLLQIDYGVIANTELTRYLDILKAILREAEIKEQDENWYTLRIESTVNVGTEVQESTEVKIPKKVYDGLK